MKRFVHMGFLAAAGVAVLVILPAAASAQRSRSALDEVEHTEARRLEGRPPPRRDGPRPEAETIVLRFECIPANSFMETFEQLAHNNERLREGLKQIPIALNEPANAVVVIAPPEVARVMMRVAAELDHPNEFERYMLNREREKLQLHRQIEEMKRQSAGRPRPPHGPHPAGPPPHAARDARGQRQGPPPPHERRSEGDTPEREAHQRIFRRKMEECEAQQRRLQEELQEHVRRVHQQLGEIEQHKRRLAEDLQRHVHQARPEHERRMHEERERQERERGERERQERGEGERPGPRGSIHGLPGLGLLLSPRLREELRLSDKQAERIRDLLAEVRKSITHVMDRVREAVKDVPPQERGERVRQMMERVRAQGAERMRAVRERLMQILAPEQRKKVEQLLRGRRPPEPPPAQQPPERPKRPEPRDRPPRQPEKTHRPAVYDGAARFYLAKQDFDKPNKSKAYKKDRPKREKPPTSKSASADRKRGVVLLRLLQDPAVRAELGLSDEQEKRIFVLHEKVQRIQDSIRTDVRDVIRNRMKQARTPQDRSDIKRQAAEIAKEATRAAGGDMETIMKEAAQVLTPDQQAKLRTINRDRAEMFRATGGLAILLAPNVREKIGISDEQADRIRPILQDISKRAKDLRAESAGGRPPEGLKRRHVEMVREARQRVMGVLSAEQREMAERLLDRGPRKGPPNRGPLEAAPATKGYGRAV